MDRAYVSEFTAFMDHFLDEHPDVVADQRRGRAIFWDRKVNLAALEQAAHDSVEIDGYYYFGLHAGKAVATREQDDTAPAAAPKA